MKSLSKGFHDWEKSPIVFGILGEPVVREKDKGDQKAGSIMGYELTLKNGSQTIVGASHMVTKAVEQVEKGAILRIEFTGKGTNDKKQPVNLFTIDQLDDQAEWDKMELDESTD